MNDGGPITAPEETALLDFLQEPAFILKAGGAIEKANKAAARLLGLRPAGQPLARFVASPRGSLDDWLRRCSGTTAPVVGAITFRIDGGEEVKFRACGARLAGTGPELRIAVRCVPLQQDSFVLLSRQVRELNAEIRHRKRTQAVLEEALADNQTLLRELHHRVKNNFQVMHSLFSAAQRESRSEEVRGFLEIANRRLLAMGTAQQLMYRSKQLRMLPAAAFITALCEALTASLGPAESIEVSTGEGQLSNEMAFPLALIINELITNAYKHGLRGGKGRIRVKLLKTGHDFTLVVHDDGPGFVSRDPERPWSGLGLVRGLCRQIGGRLAVDNVEGARVTIHFSDDMP